MVWGTMLGVCKPLHHFWNQYSDPTGGTCIQANYFYFMVGIINMVIDLLIVSQETCISHNELVIDSCGIVTHTNSFHL